MNSLFSPADYLLYRQGYPGALFEVLKGSLLRPLDLPHVLDLGAGTGLSAESFHCFFSRAQLTLLEPDAKMLEVAKDCLSHAEVQASFLQAHSEDIPLGAQSVDGVLVGSAWHWMRQPETIMEMERILKPGGWVFIFEYQFPKAKPRWFALNEWIRRQFNLLWKAPGQIPRGTLFEITEGIRKHQAFSQQAAVRLEEELELTPDLLAGLIFSQSRFQHFESSLSVGERHSCRQDALASIRDLILPDAAAGFQYLYEGYLFKKRQS